MTFKMSHDRFLRLLAYISKMFICSLFQCPLCFSHIYSLVTFAANECIDNIPIAATWILSCLIFGVSCRTPYLFSVHSIAYLTGACAVFLFQCLICLTMNQGISQVLVPSICHNWGFFGTLLSSCQTYVTQAGVSELSYVCLAGVSKR